MIYVLRVLAEGLLLAVVLLALTACVAEAQRLRLTITGGAPITFPTVTDAHYIAGSVQATTPLGFSMQLRFGNAGALRTGILSIRAASGVMGGSKPIGDMQWRRSDLGAWNSLTTSNVTVESRTMRRNPAINNPWTNSLVFRTLLSWANDGPASYAPTIILTATLTTP